MIVTYIVWELCLVNLYVLDDQDTDNDEEETKSDPKEQSPNANAKEDANNESYLQKVKSNKFTEVFLISS